MSDTKQAVTSVTIPDAIPAGKRPGTPTTSINPPWQHLLQVRISLAGYLLTGTVAFLLIVALSVGLTNKGNDGDNNVAPVGDAVWLNNPNNNGLFGDEFYMDRNLGIRISQGLNVRLIARTGTPVQYANGGRSKSNYHTKSDAAGVIPMNPDDPIGDEGYAYVTNSEEGNGDGGVYAIYFDKNGNILDCNISP